MLHSSIWGAVPVILPGGNLGVTVFFVLSGFLITTLLLDEHGGTGQIDLRAFYLRRAARLLPGMLVLLPIYVLIFSHQQSPLQLLATVGPTLLYLSSFVQAIWGAMGPLGWTWSLSVEEHFYVCWPPLLRWLLNGASTGRRGARGRLRRHPLVLASAIAALIVAAATVLRVAVTGSPHGNQFAYYSTFTRIDALAVGCLAALIGHRRRSRLPPAAGWAALLVIGWCYLNPAFSIGQTALNLYGLPVCTVAAAILTLTVVNQPLGQLSRMLSFRPLVHLGTVSYGLYLWNLLPGQTWHLISGRHAGTLGTICCFAVMVVAVELSYWYVERPVLRWAKSRLAGSSRGLVGAPLRVLSGARSG
jgi:peptidoglycan/LPS O-acetylase OafA/YrhL